MLRSTCSENVILSVLAKDLGTEGNIACNPRFFARSSSEWTNESTVEGAAKPRVGDSG